MGLRGIIIFIIVDDFRTLKSVLLIGLGAYAGSLDDQYRTALKLRKESNTPGSDYAVRR
jgi:hypothetical protein